MRRPREHAIHRWNDRLNARRSERCACRSRLRAWPRARHERPTARVACSGRLCGLSWSFNVRSRTRASRTCERSRGTVSRDGRASRVNARSGALDAGRSDRTPRSRDRNAGRGRVERGHWSLATRPRPRNRGSTVLHVRTSLRAARTFLVNRRLFVLHGRQMHRHGKTWGGRGAVSMFVRRTRRRDARRERDERGPYITRRRKTPFSRGKFCRSIMPVR